MSREVGRIVIDLPVELEPGRGADRPIRPPSGGAALPRARVPVADRPAAGVEHRADRLRRRRSRRRRADCSSPRPAGRGTPADDAPAEDGTARPAEAVRTRPDCARSGRGDRARRPADRSQRRRDGRAASRGSRPTATRSGWAGPLGAGRPLERRAARHRAGRRATAPPGTCRATRRASRSSGCRPGSAAPDRPLHRPRPEAAGHDAGADAGVELAGPFFDTLVAGYMVNPALRSQTLDDLAANAVRRRRCRSGR